MQKYLVYATENGNIPLYKNNKVIEITDSTKLDDIIKYRDNLELYFHIGCPIAANMHKKNMKQKFSINMDKYSQPTTKFTINKIDQINKDGTIMPTNNISIPQDSLIFLITNINQLGGNKIIKCYINYD
jgi:hypothetical protein